MTTPANTPETSLLGREVAYPERYDPRLLFPIPRAQAREGLGIRDDALPFIGFDAWHAYELGWLDPRGKPVAAVARIEVPADSPRLIESKSLKLYLNSFNGERMADAGALQARIEADLANAAGAPVRMSFGLPPIEATAADCIDDIEIDIDHYGPPDAGLLQVDAADIVPQRLHSRLLKSNCPVTGQPDWASVTIDCEGPRIDRAGLLRYLVSFRDHREFHEQCVERIFIDLSARCAPARLSVEARYTRRGGLDINPWRATRGHPPPPAVRDLRQ